LELILITLSEVGMEICRNHTIYLVYHAQKGGIAIIPVRSIHGKETWGVGWEGGEGDSKIPRCPKLWKP